MDMAARADELLSRLRAGDGQALGELFELFRERLWRMLAVRLDRRLAGRLSVEDVLQDTFLDVAARLVDYLDQPAVPVYVWLRFLTLQRMKAVQRAHLGARIRDVRAEVPLPEDRAEYACSDSMAGQLAGDLTSPSQGAVRRELQERLRDALDAMDPLDREVLALRHFEELSNAEAAVVLGISKDAASKRYVRSLQRLRDILDDPG